MAHGTDPSLQKQVIYSVFVRNHTAEGTFRALIADLDRIRSLGTDIIWLMPIQPIGEVKRKGSLGSPYAISDYRAVNPEYGTLEDFRTLVDEIHNRDMKCMIDVVYNHTSPDSVLWRDHPEFFYKRPDGTPGNHVGDWTDIIDLDYNIPELWDYQIETLTYWAQIVDGFRCDVASFVPVAFWLRARREIAAFKPGFIWLAESVHRSFSTACRRLGMYCARDVDAYEAFDIEYEYDIREAFDRYLDGSGSLEHWTDLLNFQEFAYPENYNKLRFLENHDTPRIAPRVKDGLSLQNYTAMLYFLKGTTMLYAGQERAAEHRPSLFDTDKVQWNAGTDLTPLLQTLARLKRETLSPDDLFSAAADEANHIAIMTRDDGKTRKAGVFSLRGLPGEAEVSLPDGRYPELLSGEDVEVSGGKLHTDGRPLWICAAI
jgi:glycosidase